jgi:cell division protein FtsN
MLRRTLLIALVLALLAPAGAAAQQTPTQQNQPAPQSGPFGPVPPSAPDATPTPAPVDDSSSSYSLTNRSTLFLIAAALLVAFIGIGVYISRDARRSLPRHHRPDSRRLREEGPHQHKRRAKAQARARGKAQKAARRRNR